MRDEQTIRSELDYLIDQDGSDWINEESYNPRCPYCVMILALKWALGEIALTPLQGIFKQVGHAPYLDEPDNSSSEKS